MTVESDILAAITRHRKGLDSLERGALEVMERRYREIAAHQLAEFEKLIGELELIRANGGTVTIGRIYRTERARSLFLQSEQQWEGFAQLIGKETDDLTRIAAIQAEKDASELAMHALGPAPPGVNAEALFTKLPTQAITDIAGLVQDGPLRDIFDGYGAKASESLQRSLVQGLAAGLNPRQVAARMAAAMGNNLTRARTIARTEMLRAYRSTHLRSYQANRTVKGWVWHSALGTRTCAACWALHGRKFAKNEPMGTHPNCRCALVPLTYTWRELGFNVPDSFESSYQPQSGLDLFEALGDGDKRAILGRKGFEQFEAGEFDLADLVREKHSKEWGITRSRGSLKMAREKKLLRGGEFPGWPEPQFGRPPLPADKKIRDKLRSNRAAEASRQARLAKAPKPKAPRATRAPKQPPRAPHAQEIDRISTGKTRADWSEAEIREAGKVSRLEIEKRANVGELELEGKRLEAELDTIDRRISELGPKRGDTFLKSNLGEIDPDDARRTIAEIDDEWGKLRERRYEILDRQSKIKPEIAERRIKATREVLGEVRPYGSSSKSLEVRPVTSGERTAYGKGRPKKRQPGGGKQLDAADLVQQAREDFPAVWWDELADASAGKPWKVGFNDRGYHNGSYRHLFLGDGHGYSTNLRHLEALKSTTRHEIGHALEGLMPDITRLEAEFFARRTAGEPLVRLRDVFPRSGYGANETTRLDKFIEPYMGKAYAHGNYELLTMGMETVLSDGSVNPYMAKAFTEDTDFLDFILGLLSAL